MRYPILRRTSMDRLLWAMGITGATFIGLVVSGAPTWALAIAAAKMGATFILWLSTSFVALQRGRWDLLMSWRLVGMTEDEADKFVQYVNEPGPVPTLAEALIDFQSKRKAS